MIKELTNQEDVAIINMFAPNIKSSKYMKQTWHYWREKETGHSNCR